MFTAFASFVGSFATLFSLYKSTESTSMKADMLIDNYVPIAVPSDVLGSFQVITLSKSERKVVKDFNDLVKRSASSVTLSLSESQKHTIVYTCFRTWWLDGFIGFSFNGKTELYGPLLDLFKSLSNAQKLSIYRFFALESEAINRKF